MIYLSLNCECQLHYWASSRASYHMKGKYRPGHSTWIKLQLASCSFIQVEWPGLYIYQSIILYSKILGIEVLFENWNWDATSSWQSANGVGAMDIAWILCWFFWHFWRIFLFIAGVMQFYSYILLPHCSWNFLNRKWDSSASVLYMLKECSKEIVKHPIPSLTHPLPNPYLSLTRPLPGSTELILGMQCLSCV